MRSAILIALLASGCAASDPAPQQAAANLTGQQDGPEEDLRGSPEVPAAFEDSVLRGTLRPIDSPLPDRAAIEAMTADPVADLTVLLHDTDDLVRQNAARCLGLFDAADLLLALARDTARGPALRTAAAEGLSRMSASTRSDHAEALAGLLSSDVVTVAFAVVPGLADLPEQRAPLERVVAAPDSHPALVRRVQASLTE